jgi:predicted RNase H-like HicB family nuclease
MTQREYIVKVHREDESDMLWAEVLDLPGCFASGANLDELREALEEAISLYLHDDPDGGVITSMAPPEHMEVGEMRVKVPA